MQPMLAGKFIADKVEAQLPVYVQPKLDGIRMIVRDGIGYTRSMKPVRSQQVQSWIAHNKESFEGKDGELIVGDPTAEDCYRRTMTSVMSFNKPDDDLKFYVFDQWDDTDPFGDRWKTLYWMEESWPEGMLACLTKLVTTMDEITEFEAELLAQGHEGVILRNPGAFYKFGRGTPSKGELIKLKQFKDAEAVIVGFHELVHNANELGENEPGYAHRTGHQENLVPMNTLGSIRAVGKWPDGTEYEVGIGTGFDQETRDEIWLCRDDWMGRIVKFKYFEGGVKEAPRFPVYLGWRDNDDTDEDTQGDLFG